MVIHEEFRTVKIGGSMYYYQFAWLSALLNITSLFNVSFDRLSRVAELVDYNFFVFLSFDFFELVSRQSLSS